MRLSPRHLAAAVSLGLAALCVSCGSGASVPAASSTAESPAHRNVTPAPCRVGKSVLPHVPGAPGIWKEGPGQPIALSCLRGRRNGGAAIVGYRSPGAGACVATYNPRLEEGIETLCRTGAESWTSQCEGEPGCIHYFVNGPGFTEFDGPMEARVKRIRVTLEGKPLGEGITVAHVEGSLQRSIGAREPFGYFAVFLNRCVVPGQVKTEFLGKGGSVLARTRGWDAVVPPCKAAAGGSTAG